MTQPKPPLPFTPEELPWTEDGHIDRDVLSELVPSARYDEQYFIYTLNMQRLYPKIAVVDSYLIAQFTDITLKKFVVGEDGEYRIWWNYQNQDEYYTLGKTATYCHYLSFVPYTPKLASFLEEVEKTSKKLRYLVIDARLNGWYNEKAIRFSLSSAKMGKPQTRSSEPDQQKLEKTIAKEIEQENIA